MSTGIVFPQIPILNLSGTGLNEGHVYIGVPGEDPVTNPQATYWDPDLSIPAEQPLDVLGGYLMYLSTPSFAWTTGSYSFAAYASDGTLVYQDLVVVPGVNGPGGAGGEDTDIVVEWTGPQTDADTWLGGEPLTRPMLFPANFSGSYGQIVTTNPASTYTVTIKNGATVLGHAICSTGGVWTFTTTGSASQAVPAGGKVNAFGPGDTTIADFSFVLKGSVSL
jgi:hypothetical protein